MRIKILSLVLYFFLSSTLRAQERYLIDWDYSGLTFNEFINKTENIHPVRFFFDEEWIKDLKLGAYSGRTTLSEVLDALLTGTGLYYYIDNAGNVILTKGFALKVTDGAEKSKGDNYLPSVYPTETSEDRQLSEILVVEIGNPSDRFKPGNVVITGYLRNTNTHEFITGATVYVQKLSKGVVTNEYGFYSLSLPRGSHLIQFSFIGMKEKRVNINIYDDGELDVEMTNALVPLKETVVTANRNITLQRYEVGLERINIVALKLMPSAMGESDILKNLLFIPGVKTVGEGSAGFNVRGGSSDQNLILLYGAPVYNASHFFGFFSAVNSDIIKDVSLYKGGIPARYGGRISSVLDIVSKDGDKREFRGNAGISPITTHIMVEGPLIKDKCSYMLAARTTYSNWVLDIINNPFLQNSRATFYDINGRLVYDINKKDKLEFSSYTSHDSFKFNSDTTYNYDNHILSFKWRHFFNNKFFSAVSFNNSQYKYSVSGQILSPSGFILSHRVNSNNFKTDFNWYPDSRNEVNFGLDLNNYAIMPGSYSPATDSSQVIPRVWEKEKALEGALYIEDKFIVTTSLSVSLGIRWSTYFAFGPRNILVYYPEMPRNKATVSDTMVYASNEVFKTYSGPEFRMSWNLRMADNSSLKFNYNRTRQYLHLLTNTTSISPTDTWKLSDYYLKPESGDQFAVGYYRMWFKNKFETSVELYYKNTRNMIDFKGGASLIMNETIEQEIINVTGKAYGLELTAKMTEGKLRWNIGYTYSRAFIRSTSNHNEEMINSGKWFPANSDKPNDLNISLNYLYSRRLSLSASYTYSTGRPITFPVATYTVRDLSLVYYSERNKYRIPYYSRLDLSAMISGNLKSKKITHPHWSFSVYNILGRQNVYSIYFRYEKKYFMGYMLSVFGKPIPSITYSFDF